jgi:hypothetical protein
MFKPFSEIVPFIRYCGKRGTARQATDGNIIWRMSLACWKIKATDKQNLKYVLLVYCIYSCTNTPHFYVIHVHSLSVLFPTR